MQERRRYFFLLSLFLVFFTFFLLIEEERKFSLFSCFFSSLIYSFFFCCSNNRLLLVRLCLKKKAKKKKNRVTTRNTNWKSICACAPAYIHTSNEQECCTSVQFLEDRLSLGFHQRIFFLLRLLSYISVDELMSKTIRNEWRKAMLAEKKIDCIEVKQSILGN